jgi:acetylornithine deacetylase/succinyl-diaminopimelate desuccinylase-like protein
MSTGCNFVLKLSTLVIGSAGYSHKPEEYASVQDIANGVKVLALTLAKLSLK